ncbi:MAG: DMT family transporter [Lachnospiraceae bacterium]|nr:DMT family transporter [Lachnospiraceae bacterium]
MRINHRSDIIILVITFFFWGSVYAASKFVYPFIPPLTVVMFRSSLSAVLFGLLLLKQGGFKREKRHLPEKKHIWVFVLTGFMMYASAVSLTNVATRFLGASMSALLNCLNPIFISFFAMLMLKEKLNARIISGIIISLIGVIVVLGVSFKGVSLPGVAFSLTAVLLWSIASVIIRKLSGIYTPVEISFYVSLCAIPFNIFYSFLELRTASVKFTPLAIAVMLYIVVCGGFIPSYLWNRSLSRNPASICSMFYPVQPMAATLLGVIILGEKLTWNFFAGAAVIFAGVLLGLSSGKRTG